ncbi:nucleolar protein 12-domain-containing protein [Kockovaella imperatae]|uniref:Nucleolar protein 12-domain-containing protein n=1 Tax=Kockovaella imperatae TaxID=4999 RepID=A0A1Y1U6U9_9TREE|nr:nucleolar protein 12-domain-containing protein [Kockovaella imperatae]ORX33722.1 nucleolar protein 12-domain-containing protein [Kockovaella imperatae]
MSSSSRPKSNIELLTEQHKYVQKARKARAEQIESIKFDDDARREWLSGFSKRKKAKVEEKRARAIERDKQAHKEERRHAREELKKKAAENVRNVRLAMGLPTGDDEEMASGDESSNEGPAVPLEDEYEDDDQIATVTITEDFDPSIPGPSTRKFGSPSSDEEGDEHRSGQLGDAEKTKKRKAVGLPDMPASSHRAQKKAKSILEQAKLEKKERQERAEKADKQSRGMETKAERKFGRAMEAKRRAKRAGIAMERDGRQRGTDKGKRKGNGAHNKPLRGRKRG